MSEIFTRLSVFRASSAGTITDFHPDLVSGRVAPTAADVAQVRVLPDQSILVAGGVKVIGGATPKGIAKLSSDGELLDTYSDDIDEERVDRFDVNPVTGHAIGAIGGVTMTLVDGEYIPAGGGDPGKVFRFTY